MYGNFICIDWVFYKYRKWPVKHKKGATSQLTHDVVTTLAFGCLLVVTSGNVEATLSQGCLSDVVALTKIWRCYNVVFSTSIFRPDTKVVVTSCFCGHFSDKNLTVYERHYDSLFQKLCKWSFNSSSWYTELILYALMQRIHSVCYILKNLWFAAWAEERYFWFCSVQLSKQLHVFT